MPLEVDVQVSNHEQTVVLGDESNLLGGLIVDDLDMTDGSENDNYLDTDRGYFSINNLTFPHNFMEVAHRTSNATVTRPTRGVANGSYAFRSKYAENLFTVTIPLLNDNEEYVKLSNDLIGDLKSFGFVKIVSSYLPRIEECYDIYSVDEFRLTLDSDLDLYILEIDIQPVNMQIFGYVPEDFQAGDPKNHIGDHHTVRALDEIIKVGDRPSLEQRIQDIVDAGGSALGTARITIGMGKDMTEFRAFLEDSRTVRETKNYNHTSYHEDDVVGDFDITFKIPHIFPKDGAISDSPITFENESSTVEVIDTSEEALQAEGADYRIFKMVDLRNPPLTVTSEDGLTDFDGNSVIPYYQGKPEDVPERAKVAKDYVVKYIADELAFDGAVHNIKTITYVKSYKFARHFIGNSSVPLTQYIGPKPANLHIVSHYAAPDMNNEYNVSEDVPQFFQRMVRHIDDNNKVYPMANAFNFIKIEDKGLNYIAGKYVPSETYRLASSENSNIEVYATNFVESDMESIHDNSKLKIATEPVSSNYTRVAADLIAKYLIVANAYFAKKDFSNDKIHGFHTTLLQRLVRLRSRVASEANGTLLSLDGFERTDYIDTSSKVLSGGNTDTTPQPDTSSSTETSATVTTPSSGGKLIIMGDSIAVGFWNSLSQANRDSDKVLMTARGAWTPGQIFSSGAKETSKKGNALSPTKIYKHSEDGTTLPSQSSMLTSSGVSLKESVVILSSGFSNDYNIKEQDLANYIISLASQVKSVHILGVATNYYISNKYGTYDGRNSKLANRLKQVHTLVQKSASNVTLGGSSNASDKVHPSPSSHTEAHKIAKDFLG